MSGSQGYADDIVEINGEAYTVTSRGGEVAPILLTPQLGFDQVAIIGDTAKVRDRRLPSIIPSDQTGGQGEDRYTEIEGITTFRESDCNTLFAGAITLRPALTSRGTFPVTPTAGFRIDYMGFGGAELLGYNYAGQSYYCPPSSTTWTSTGVPGVATTQYCRWSGYAFLGLVGNGVSRSSDGITWNVCANTGTTGGSTFAGVVAHDNKLYIVGITSSGSVNVATLYVSTDAASAAAGSVTWTALASVQLQAPEQPVRLIEWRDASGVRAVYLQTSQNLYGYDESGAVLQHLLRYHAQNPTAATGPLTGLVWNSSDDLFLTLGTNVDYVQQLTGRQQPRLTPNRGGGLSAVRQGSPAQLAEMAYRLAVFVVPSNVNTAGKGQTLLLTEQGQFHTIYRDTSGSASVMGGGATAGKVYTALSSAQVWEQVVPDNLVKPFYQTSPTYDTTVGQTHTYAITDGGTELLDKLCVGFIAHLKKRDGTFGLETNTTVKVEYQIDGGTWTTVTQAWVAGAAVTLTSSVIAPTQITTYPVTLLVNGGLGTKFKELAWRATLTSSNSANTPVLVALAPLFLRRPQLRFNAEFTIDLREETLGAMNLGKGALVMRQALEALPDSGSLVTFSYATMGATQTWTAAEIQVSPSDDPYLGAGFVRVAIRDMTPLDSG